MTTPLTKEKREEMREEWERRVAKRRQEMKALREERERETRVARRALAMKPLALDITVPAISLCTVAMRHPEDISGAICGHLASSASTPQELAAILQIGLDFAPKRGSR